MDNKKVLDANLSLGKSSVKKLVERFEKPEIVTVQNKHLFKCHPISRHHSSKQVFADIYQKRNIPSRQIAPLMCRIIQSKNHTDIRPNEGSSAIAGRRGVMFKSYSHEDQIDFIAAIRRDMSRKSTMKSNNADTVIALVTPLISGNVEHDDACDRSLLVQSMFASNSDSYATEQERESRNRPKPLPPIKPATLKNKIAHTNIKSSFSSISKFVSIADESLPEIPFNKVDSSEIATYEGRNNRTKKIKSEDTTVESDKLFEAMRITELSIEKFKGIENESLTLLPAQMLSSRTTATNKRTSFINEEIKKPKIKPPPPPPIQSHSPHSEGDDSKIETIKKN
ncbi:hypothetical protein DINM_005190 [Dirofilaria immitis]|nr:hypothetical protein [Dirofilaria immitis]